MWKITLSLFCLTFNLSCSFIAYQRDIYKENDSWEIGILLPSDKYNLCLSPAHLIHFDITSYTAQAAFTETYNSLDGQLPVAEYN